MTDNVKVGDKLNFYNVSKKTHEKAKVDNIIYKSNKKGGTVYIATGKGKSGERLCQFIRKPSKSKQSHKKSQKKSHRKSSKKRAI